MRGEDSATALFDIQFWGPLFSISLLHPLPVTLFLTATGLMSVSNAFVTVVSFAERVANPFSLGLRDTVRAGGPLHAACHVQLDSHLSLHAPLGHDLN